MELMVKLFLSSKCLMLHRSLKILRGSAADRRAPYEDKDVWAEVWVSKDGINGCLSSAYTLLMSSFWWAIPSKAVNRPTTLFNKLEVPHAFQWHCNTVLVQYIHSRLQQVIAVVCKEVDPYSTCSTREDCGLQYSSHPTLWKCLSVWKQKHPDRGSGSSVQCWARCNDSVTVNNENMTPYSGDYEYPQQI